MGFLPQLLLVDSVLIFGGGLYGHAAQGSKASIIASAVCSLVLIAWIYACADDVGPGLFSPTIFDVGTMFFGVLLAAMFFQKSQKARRIDVSSGAEDLKTPLVKEGDGVSKNPQMTEAVRQKSVRIFIFLAVYNALLVFASIVVLLEVHVLRVKEGEIDMFR